MPREKIRIVSATNNRTIDQWIREIPGATVVREVYFRKAVAPDVRKFVPEVLVLSAFLPGNEDLLDIIHEVQLYGARIVFLPGPPPPQGDTRLVASAWLLGVRDFVFDDIDRADIERAILSPASYADSVEKLFVQNPLTSVKQGIVSELIQRITSRTGRQGAIKDSVPADDEGRRMFENLLRSIGCPPDVPLSRAVIAIENALAEAQRNAAK